MIGMFESKVHFVTDSLAGDTEVPDSQLAMVEGDEEDKPDFVDDALLEVASTVPDVVDAHRSWLLLRLANFNLTRRGLSFLKLLLPFFLPRLYGDHEQDVNVSAVDLFWIREKSVGV